MMTPHRLTVWRKADLLVQRICATVASDPAAAHADLAVRLRGAATDVVLAIDAGSRASSAPVFGEQIELAMARTLEVQYLLILLQVGGRLATSESARLLARADQVQRMLAGLLRTIEGKGRAVSKAHPQRDAATRALTRRRLPSSPSTLGD